MKILAISDTIVDWIYSPRIRQIFSDVELVLGCGDLPAYYMEYIVSSLDVPLLHVNGNHSIPNEKLGHRYTDGTTDLHCKVVDYKGCTFAGIEGSIRYKDEGGYQYSQTGMWLNVFKIVPSLISNRIKYGRYLNVFITHAPAWGIHDQTDLAHRGIKAFRWVLTKFQPDYHLHGHIHVYRPDMITMTEFYKTKVVNVFGYRKLEL